MGSDKEAPRKKQILACSISLLRHARSSWHLVFSMSHSFTGAWSADPLKAESCAAAAATLRDGKDDFLVNVFSGSKGILAVDCGRRWQDEWRDTRDDDGEACDDAQLEAVDEDFDDARLDASGGNLVDRLESTSPHLSGR